jgi:ubiquinone/menaquinone biosynthesis C-methylase UbiE
MYARISCALTTARAYSGIDTSNGRRKGFDMTGDVHAQDMEPAHSHEWGTAPDFVGPRHELREKLLLDVLIHAEPGDVVLNAGAGLGSFSRRLEARGFDVTSTDVSPAAVDHLRRVVRGPVAEADLEALPFDNASFDAVVLGEVLEHVRDDIAGLREVARVLVPGGWWRSRFPPIPPGSRTAIAGQGTSVRYSRGALRAACEAANLRVETCKGWGFPVASSYHRWVYDRRAAKLAAGGPPSRVTNSLMLVLKGLLQIDRLFVGVDRGALGYLVVARRVPDGR